MSENYNENKITVLIVEPEKVPYVKEISDNLESLQHEVSGYIQAVYPFDDTVAIICKEEGKLQGLPLNRALYDEDGQIYDIIAGTFVISGLTEDNFGSLTDEQISKYIERFKTPERFALIGQKIVVIPVEKAARKKKDVERGGR